MEKQYKRTTRTVPQTVRTKISNSLKSYNNTHLRDDSHKAKISAGLKKYWDGIPKTPQKTDAEMIEDGDVV